MMLCENNDAALRRRCHRIKPELILVVCKQDRNWWEKVHGKDPSLKADIEHAQNSR
jgi:hypothetical protein